MKQLSSAYASAINRAEKTLRDKRRSGTPTPQERGHEVTKLADKRAKQRAKDASEIVNQVRRLGVDGETLARVHEAAEAHAKTSEQWIFVMLSPQQNAEVIRWINKNSKRPHKAVELWATLLENLRIDTGEITASRSELAARIGVAPRTLSETMTELASINAIRREKEGRAVKYYLNPCIATHLPNASARKTARSSAGPLLKLMEKDE